jgi:hypothetical protein
MDAKPDRRRARIDGIWLAVLAATLLAVMLYPYVAHGYRFGVGPDMPVYLWWARVGASEGLSLVGARPGTPALIAVLAGTLRLPIVAVAAGLQAALGASIGAAAAVLVRGRTRDVPDRLAWIAAGGLAGLFAVHLGAGYVANLVFVLAFLAAGVVLSTSPVPRGRAATAGAGAVLLAGGGLAHPQFFVVGAGILVGVAAWTWSGSRGDRPVLTDERRPADPDADRRTARGIVVAVGSASLAVVAGVASMLLGPARLDVDTSKDAFLRRAGLTSTLRTAYLDRFVQRWTRYVQFLSIPLAIAGATRTAGLVGRFLVGWALAMLAGVPIGIVTGWYPADRLMTFSFPIPILAGVGLAWTWQRLAPRRVLAGVVVAGLAGAMAAGAMMAWDRQAPFLSALEVDRVTIASRIADLTPIGTPLVFVVDDDDATATFLATRAANVIRAVLPPDRAADAHVFVGTPEDLLAGRPTVTGDPEYDALSRLYLDDIPTGGPAEPMTLVVVPFNRTAAGRAEPALHRWSRGVFAGLAGTPSQTRPARDPLEPSTPAGIAVAAVATLVLASGAGYGWSRWAVEDRVTAIALAPAFGVAVLVLVGIALERVGLALSGSAGPTTVTLVAAGGGYVARVVAERRARTQAAAPVG